MAGTGPGRRDTRRKQSPRRLRTVGAHRDGPRAGLLSRRRAPYTRRRLVATDTVACRPSIHGPPGTPRTHALARHPRREFLARHPWTAARASVARAPPPTDSRGLGPRLGRVFRGPALRPAHDRPPVSGPLDAPAVREGQHRRVLCPACVGPDSERVVVADLAGGGYTQVLVSDQDSGPVTTEYRI